MIGIIVWAILIIFIAICVNPGFLTFLFLIALPVGIGVFLLMNWLKRKFGG